MIQPQTIRVLCADDNSSIRRLLVRLVDGESDMKTVGWIESADGLIHAVQKLGPDVVLLDLSMPGRDPIDALRELSGISPQTHVIVFSAHDDPELVHTAIDSGARSFLVKDGSIDRVLATIREVAAS